MSHGNCTFCNALWLLVPNVGEMPEDPIVQVLRWHRFPTNSLIILWMSGIQ